MKKHIIVLASLAIAVCSCGNKNEFNIEGNIEGAGDKTLLLEASLNGRWFVLDSTKIESDGDFEISRKAPRFPEIYRLTLNEQSVYFPIDSLDHLTLKSKINGFATDYTLSGSENAENMMKVDKKAQTLYSANIKEAVIKKEKFKRELAEQILVAPSSILAYYIINKQVNDEPLFSPENSVDLKIIGAVANAYNTFKPTDPRTAFLVKTLIDGQRARRNAIAKVDTMYVSESNIINITLPDRNGKTQDLNKVASKGNVVLLNFTAYSAQESPAFNKILSDIYNKNKSRGFEIFQIGLDPDVAQWKVAASNLPWITVYDEAGIKSRNLAIYNVSSIPTIFLIDRNGEIVERITDINALESTVNKHI